MDGKLLKKSLNDRYPELFVLFERIFFLLFLYTLIRVYFLLRNAEVFDADINSREIIQATFVGIRADLIALCIINIIPFIVTLICIWNRFTRIPGIITFIFFNLPFLSLCIIDTEYYRYIGRRMSISILSIQWDISRQAPNLAFYYWYVVGLIVLFNILFVKYLFRNNKVGLSLHGCIKLIALLLIGWLPSTIPRNTEQERRSPVLRYITSSTITSLLNAGGVQKIMPQKMIDAAIMEKTLQRDRSHHNFTHITPQNIVILICESLSMECMEKGYTPFLQKLSQNGVLLDHCYANGRESIDAVPAVICGIPRLSENPFIYYSQLTVKQPSSIADLLRPLGYKSLFFHGARNGSMGFMNFTLACGYDKYYGMDDYVGPKKHFDNAWGIYDQYFLTFADSILSHTISPFHAVFFTLSAHSPYHLPQDYTNAHKDNASGIHATMRYADYSLELFFKSIASEKWYPNTLFIITGDHTHLQSGSNVSAYRIPLIMFHPDNREMTTIRNNISTDKTCQQTDILATLLDFLHLDQSPALPFGESLFSHSKGWAVNFHEKTYCLISGKEEYYFSKHNASNNLNITTQSGYGGIDSVSTTLLITSLIQYYNNNLLLPMMSHRSTK